MLWQTSWTMAFACLISTLGILLDMLLKRQLVMGKVMHGEAVSMGMVHLGVAEKKRNLMPRESANKSKNVRNLPSGDL